MHRYPRTSANRRVSAALGDRGPLTRDLRHIRKAVDDLRLDMSDVKSRMTAVEVTMGQIISLLAAQSGRMDRIEDRLGRVERRLDLANAVGRV